MGCGGLGGLGGWLEGWVSGGLHQGVSRVPPLDSVMAVHGTLIPPHHRLEGPPVLLVRPEKVPVPLRRRVPPVRCRCPPLLLLRPLLCLLELASQEENLPLHRHREVLPQRHGPRLRRHPSVHLRGGLRGR